MIKLYNGEYINNKNFSRGFYYGYGCFETIMGLNGELIFLSDHVERLKQTIDYLGITLDIDIYSKIKEYMITSGLKNEKEFYIKITVRDNDYLIEGDKFYLREAKNGIKISSINNYYQNEIGYIKSNNYLINNLARKDVLEKECFEGVFQNRKGEITEGTISNIFFIKDNIVKTPALSLNILPGIVREKIKNICLKKDILFEEGYYTLDDLYSSDAIFMTNSLMKHGLLWVYDIDGKIKIKTDIINIIENEYVQLRDILQK